MTRILAAEESQAALEAWAEAAGALAEAAASHPGVETLQGRGRVHVVPSPTGDGRWVVRHYHRGGAVASLLGDRYLRVGEPRPFREFRVGRRLEELGVPVPRHLGAAVYPSGAWYRGDLVTELVPDSHDLAAVLFEGAGGSVDEEEAMRAAGSLVRYIHDAGVIHRDLNLKNVLIAPGSTGRGGSELRALILDLDRATIRGRVGQRARARMLSRFWRSARKWEGRTGRTISPGLRSAFERGYG